MKDVISFLIILVVFYASSVYAASEVGYGSIRLCADGCDMANSTNPGDYTYNTSEAAAACIALSSYIQGQAKIYNISCPNGIDEYETTDAFIQNIVGVPVGTETAVGRNAFEVWAAGFTPPACSAEHANGAIGEGYIFVSEPGSVPSESTLHVTMWKRRDCSTAGGGLLEPIGTIGGGSGGGGGGGSTDMTATNDLLTQIKDVIEASDGSTDMTDTNALLTQIKVAVEASGGTDMTVTNETLIAVKDSIEAGNLSSQQTNEILTLIKDAIEAGGSGGSTDMTVTNDLLTQIKTAVEGSGGSTDMTVTNDLLTQVKAAIEASGSGGSTDMTDTNGFLSGISDLLTSIDDYVVTGLESLTSLVSSVSGDSSLGGYVDNTALKESYSSSFFETGTPTLDSYKGAFNGFTNDMKTTPLFGLVGGFFGGAPKGGTSIVSFDGGVYGTHSYNFSSWSSIMSVTQLSQSVIVRNILE